MSIGPVANIGTLTGGINLDVSRLLNWGKTLVMEFYVPDASVPVINMRLILTLTKGFDRVNAEEKTSGEASDVIFKVADPTGTVGAIIRDKDLHVKVDGVFYKVSDVPPVAPNTAQIYTLTTKVRVIRGPFDATK